MDRNHHGVRDDTASEKQPLVEDDLGAKVAVSKAMSQCVPSNPNNMNENLDIHRAIVNAGIRAAVGTKIDAVIDYAADPVLGPNRASCNTTIFPDGTHPSPEDQALMATIYAPVVDRLLQ